MAAGCERRWESGTHGWVAGKGEFGFRREGAEAVIGLLALRLGSEDGLRQVELAGDCLHSLIVEALAIVDDGERIAGKRRVGENIEDVIGAFHRLGSRIGEMGGSRLLHETPA